MTLRQHLAQKWQHRGVCKVKHYRADKKYDKWPILQQCKCLDGVTVPVAFHRAPRPLVIDFLGTDEVQSENGRERAN